MIGKTKTAALIGALLAINHLLNALGLPHVPAGLEQSLLAFVGSLGLWGLRDAIGKNGTGQ